MNIEITELSFKKIPPVAHLARKLWPDNSIQQLSDEFIKVFDSSNDIVYIIERVGIEIGFAHFSLRNDYVEGTSSSPVGYIEGIYIEEGYREKGYAKELLNKGVEWAKEKGCSEIASDCEITNNVSQEFHKRIDFKEFIESFASQRSFNYLTFLYFP